MRTLIIHNNRSGFGSDAIFEFERSLAHPGDEVVTRIPTPDFVPHDCVADAKDFDLIVISGGDGTMASFLYELRGQDIPCCVFPSGTSNLLFLNLGNAQEPAAIARSCRIGNTIMADLGEMSWTDEAGTSHTKGFCLMSGMGYDGNIMRTATEAKGALGEVAYFAAAATNLTPPVAHFTITVDGKTYEREGISCMVAGGTVIQNDIEVVPNNSITDGLEEVIVLEAQQPAGLLRPISRALFERKPEHDRPYIENFKGRVIDVVSDIPVPLQIDGDPMADAVTHYHAEVIPQANRLIVDAVSRYASEAQPSQVKLPGTSVRPFPPFGKLWFQNLLYKPPIRSCKILCNLQLPYFPRDILRRWHTIYNMVIPQLFCMSQPLLTTLSNYPVSSD